MNAPSAHQATQDSVGVCICTFKRPELLRRLLDALAHQRTDGLFTYSISIVDNDKDESARETVAHFAKLSPVPVTYVVEPTPNIALARNKVVQNATGEYLAFIDDDEFPREDWLLVLLQTCRKFAVAGVLGPVLPHFETTPPGWLTRAGFYDRARHQTGFVLAWQEARTGNVLIRSSILHNISQIFKPEFGAGGEDQDFFRRMMAAGHKFIWCDEAPAYETVPPHRWQRRFLIRRALLRGKTTFRHPENRIRNLAKSAVAVPLYVAALPLLLVAGHHVFMRYLVRLFDHLGRLLALMNLNPVSERNN